MLDMGSAFTPRNAAPTKAVDAKAADAAALASFCAAR
jgi:hypothetical protein